ncbi:hypothetical protein [Actinospica acidiphila]|uniref:hypothetical protein n=1 Tax=Actinospica acidiphila TaxID=304899 RepID=UPI000AA4309A|nr:hypothetical protein [Actinospica acidiphila]
MIVNLVLVVAVFALVPLALGGRMGPVEIILWLCAQLAALAFVISRYVRQRRATRTEPTRS